MFKMFVAAIASIVLGIVLTVWAFTEAPGKIPSFGELLPGFLAFLVGNFLLTIFVLALRQPRKEQIESTIVDDPKQGTGNLQK